MEGNGSRFELPFEKKSLNNGARKKTLLDITLANQALLKRLQEKQSNYDVMRWEQERVENEQLVKRIGFHSSLAHENLNLKTHSTLPTLKNPRQATTRMSKRRIKKDYQTNLNLFGSEVNNKRAKTTKRKHKRVSSTVKSNDNTLDIDFAKI